MQAAEVYISGAPEPFPSECWLLHPKIPSCLLPAPLPTAGMWRVSWAGMGALGIPGEASLLSAPANFTASLISIWGSDVLLWNFPFSKESQNCQKESNSSAFDFLIRAQERKDARGFKKKSTGARKVHTWLLAGHWAWAKKHPQLRCPDYELASVQESTPSPIKSSSTQTVNLGQTRSEWLQLLLPVLLEHHSFNMTQELSSALLTGTFRWSLLLSLPESGSGDENNNHSWYL